jgi:short subunit dehydrogenase-like uncharacterized protein
MQNNSFLLYGANGYTGELIARFAADYNLSPILVGRRREAVKPLAQKLNLRYEIVNLEDKAALLMFLRKVKLVVHAAGPFKFTAKQMVEACLITGTHYIDINGDISVFEMLKGYDREARHTGITLIPGAGFDVVPTDCTALMLKKLLPDAVSLKLAFATLNGGVSHGTAMSLIEKLGEGGAVRRNGKIIRKPLGQKGMMVDFGEKELFVMSIPWGDVSTAYTTTGIPDIEAYTAISKKIYRVLKWQFLFNWLLRMKFIRKIIKKKIAKRPAGPTDEQRSKAVSIVWGKAVNAKGKTAIARLRCPDGYTLTAHSSLLIAKKILEGNFEPGYQTPAGVYGEKLVFDIPGVKKEILDLKDP